MKKPKFQEVAQQYCLKRDLQFVKYLGNGAFKEVYLVQNTTTTIALKIIDPQKVDHRRLEREVRTVQVCRSPHIAIFYRMEEDVFNGVEYLFITEEYLSGGTLSEKISQGCLGNSEVKTLGLAITSSIQCMWEHHLVHRDIKPDNIMYRESNMPVLVDFGLVRDLSASSLTQNWIAQGPGTPFFASPEQLNNDKSLIDWKTDQFCLGVVLALAISGNHPFDIGQGRVNTVTNVAQRTIHSKGFEINTKKEWFPLIKKMTAVWPYKRYQSISQLIKDIEEIVE